MRLNKIGILIFFILVLSMNCFALDFGIVKQDAPISIKTNYNATYCNITSVNYPNTTTAVSNGLMTKSSTQFNYTFISTNTLGSYLVYGDCDNNVWQGSFKVTKTGMNDTSIDYNLPIVIALISLSFFFVWISRKDNLPFINEPIKIVLCMIGFLFMIVTFGFIISTLNTGENINAVYYSLMIVGLCLFLWYGFGFLMQIVQSMAQKGNREDKQ